MTQSSGQKDGTHPLSSGQVSFTPDHSDDLFTLDGYGGGAFRAQGARVEGTVVVSQNGIMSVGEIADYSALKPEHFQGLLAQTPRPELILIGVGEKMQLLSSELRAFFDKEECPVEVMDTGAAARTYNVLLAEGRRVVAFMLPVD